MTEGRNTQDDIASAAAAVDFREEARLFREHSRDLRLAGDQLYLEAKALDLTAAHDTALAAAIERDLRGLPPAAQPAA